MPNLARTLIAPLAGTLLLVASACTSTPTASSTTPLPDTASPSSQTQGSPSPTETAPPETATSAPTETTPVPSDENPSTDSSEEAPQEPDSAPAEETEQAAPEESTTFPVNDGYTIDPAAITTAELTTGTPVADVNAFGFAAADQPSVVFQSPDNSVACLLQPYGAFCMTDDSVNWVLLSISMKPGATVPRSIQAQGRAATHQWFTTGTPLPEGQSISWMGMTCTSVSPSAIHCHDGLTGFTLSDAEGR